MKPEYREKVLSHIEGINARTKAIREMIEGKRPTNQKDAMRFTNEIERLLELVQNLVVVS